MHYCLQVIDILLEVVDNLSPPPEGRLQHPQKFTVELRTLAAMARTCQAFYEPCMNALWKVNHSLGCITHSLPLTLPAGLCDTALLARCYANASRVVYLRLRPYLISTNSGNLIGSAALDSPLALIHSYIGMGRPIFPNLQALALDGGCEEGGDFIRDILLSPKLNQLILLSGLDMKYVETALLQISENCHKLKTLELSSWTSHWDPILARLETLESITYNRSTRLHESTVCCLARLPNLHSLNILPPHISHDTFSIPPNSFDSLRQLILLEIHDSDVESVTLLLSLLAPGRLLHLDMRFDVDGRDIGMFNRMFEVIGTNLWNLQTLSLLGWGPEVAGDDPAYNIRPLLRLNSLRSLSIRLVGMLGCFTDGVIGQYGDMWPNLREFIFFQTLYYRMTPAGLTLKSLPIFAQHFPNLRRLALELDATGDPPTTDTGTPSDRYIELDLSRSLIGSRGPEDCAKVAAYISEVFPNCSMQRVLAPMRFRKTTLHEDETKCWQTVIELVEARSRRCAGVNGAWRQEGSGSRIPGWEPGTVGL